MAAIPLYQRGRDLVSVVLTGQTVGTAGALSDSTAVVTLTAVMNGFDESLTPTKAEINALNTTRENNVVLSDGFTMNFSVLKVNNASDPSPLRAVITSFDVFKAVITQGTGASARTETAYGSRGSYSESFQGRGQQVASLSLDSVDAGTAWISRT